MKVKRLNFQEQRHSYDISLLFVTLFLCVFGLIMVYSSSYYTAQMKGLGGDYYFKRQLISNLVGIVGLVILSLTPYRLFKWAVLPAYLVGILLMGLTNFTSLGHTAGGRTRWITLGPLRFQGAEVVKLAVILLCSFLILSYAKDYRGWKLYSFLLVVTAIPALLVFNQDLSSAFIIMMIPLFMIILINGNKKSAIVIGILLVLALIAVLTLKFMSLERLMSIGEWLVAHTPLKEYQVRRLYVWNDPGYDALGDGYQVLQGLYAIGSGGVFGKGLGAGTQKLGFVPEASNDMIFAILCEELGFFGAMALIMLYIFMLYRMVQIANRADDVFGAMLTVGVMTQIALQAVLHIGVVTNVLPNTGISLPFISYGGTSSAFLLAEVGMVLSVGRGNTLVRKKK